MIRDYDARDEVEPAPAGMVGGEEAAQRRRASSRAAERVSRTMPGDARVEVVSLDETTGGPAVVVSHGGDAQRGDFVRRAMDHVQRIGDVLGLVAGQPSEFQPDPDYQETSQGGVAVHLQQLQAGIPIYDGAQTVRFDPAGRLVEVAGRTHPVEDAPDAVPTTTADAALRVAVGFLAESAEDEQDDLDPFGQRMAPTVPDPATFSPEHVSGPAAQPDRATVMTAPELDGPVTGQLLWFPVGRDLRLGWTMVVSLPGGSQWRMIVDAHDRTVLLCRSLVHSLSGTATLQVRGGGEPAEDVTMALGLDRYPVQAHEDLPEGFPDDWLRDASTDGENVRALRVDEGSFVSGQLVDGDVRFAPDDPTDDLVVHLFFYNGLMHDLLYLLGFRERDGNFQRSDRGRGGPAGDAVVAHVHPGPVFGTANMRTPIDGRPPEMNMGLVSSTGRHTALDVDVVAHEYTHGLTNRLVGGPMNQFALEEIQSGGMGEGWGDYFACVLTDRDTVGSWVIGRATGIRSAPYDEHYPNTYADVGTGRFTKVHALGEIWCATLLELNRRVTKSLGAQLVVDALKLSVANPSFLAMRDAILVAADQYASANGLATDEHENLRHRIWEAFATFGMGPGARTDGPSLRGIVADPEPPPRPDSQVTEVVASATPSLAIPDDAPSGVASTLALVTDGHLRSLAVAVDIAHTYRGDLLVRLEGPAGRTVTLHDRTGGSRHDLVETWSSDEVNALGTLVGGAAGGDWTLRVSDHARRDVGVLRGWEIRARVGEARPVETLAATPALAIPDHDPAGVTSTVTSSEVGPLRSVALHLDITHTFIGDLEVVLRAPGGQEVTIHSGEGGGDDDLIRSYGSGDGQVLVPLVGLAGTGEWQLEVIDHTGRDVGKLNRWRLDLER